MDIPISRREFLKASGIVAGSLAIGGAFTGCASTSSPVLEATENGPISYPKLRGYKIQPPETGCFTGIWMGPYPALQIENYKEKIGKKPTFMFIKYRYETSITHGLLKMDDIYACAKIGVIPFISLDARDLLNESRSILKDVYNGVYDEQLIETAQKLKKFSEDMLEYGYNPGFFIRTMREINGGYWPWSGSANKFKQAWKHIHNIFESEGTNEYATWVLQFTTTFTDAWSMRHYILDKKYFDWASLTVYNYGSEMDGEISFSNKVRPFYDYLAKRLHSKPIMSGETGCYSTFYRDNWIRNMFNDIENKLPRIKGFAWWHDRWQNSRMTMDTRFFSIEDDRNAYKKGISSDYFKGSIVE